MNSNKNTKEYGDMKPLRREFGKKYLIFSNKIRGKSVKVNKGREYRNFLLRNLERSKSQEGNLLPVQSLIRHFSVGN